MNNLNLPEILDFQALNYNLLKQTSKTQIIWISKETLIIFICNSFTKLIMVQRKTKFKIM